MVEFDKFWSLVSGRGRVAHFYRLECEALWKNYTPVQQQAICDNIERKIQSGAFVHYNPAIAMQDNLPRKIEPQVMSYDQYYRTFHTDLEQDGWKRVHLPDQQKTIFIKQK